MVLTKSINTAFWLKLSVFNFVLLGIIGVIMRYKICYEFPLFDQKHLQLAHSNFAFTGWVTQTLMVLMIGYLKEWIPERNLQQYRIILTANLICAFGLLLSFSTQGYGAVSIVFSALSVFIGFWFAFQFFYHLKEIQNSPSKLWFKAALFFMIISAVGTFSLAYMMATKHIDQHIYLATIYWYLHFQYNGWFFFACIGLLLNIVKNDIVEPQKLTVLFYVFAASCLVTYILSVLWLNLSMVFILLAMIAAAAQLWVWFRIVLAVKKPLLTLCEKKSPVLKYILIVLALAVTIKLMLQLGSTIPAVSKLAFGFRPVVIAYLHLVLLAIISMFLIVFIWISKGITEHKFATPALAALVAMVYINQAVLGVQAIASFANYFFSYINQLLLAIAILLVTSLGFVWIIVLKIKEVAK